MFEYLVKRVVCAKVNKLLADNKRSVDEVRETLGRWIGRLEKALACLRSLLAKIDDGEVTPDEVREAADEVNALVKEW